MIIGPAAYENGTFIMEAGTVYANVPCQEETVYIGITENLYVMWITLYIRLLEQ